MILFGELASSPCATVDSVYPHALAQLSNKAAAADLSVSLSETKLSEN